MHLLLIATALEQLLLQLNKAEGRGMDSKPALRFVTASLKIDYLAPTPLGVELEIRG